jgi:hypothetical protein
MHILFLSLGALKLLLGRLVKYRGDFGESEVLEAAVVPLRALLTHDMFLDGVCLS